jgi:universal stress protein E
VETGVLIEVQEAMAPFVRDLPETLLNDARSRWQSFATELPKPRVNFEVSVGTPIAELTRRIQEHKPDLLIAGTHGTSGATSGGVGTLAAQLVRRIPADVLLVRERQTGPFTRIVAGVDFSGISRRALAAAARIAALDDAELHILHVFRAPWKQVHWHSPTPQASPDFQKQFSDALIRRLEDFAQPVVAEAAERPGASRGGQGLSRPPIIELFDSTSHGAGIAEYATRIGADLVVLGTRGRTMKHLFLGSTAERLLREISCSVLAVEPHGPHDSHDPHEGHETHPDEKPAAE